MITIGIDHMESKQIQVIDIYDGREFLHYQIPNKKALTELFNICKAKQLLSKTKGK